MPCARVLAPPRNDAPHAPLPPPRPLLLRAQLRQDGPRRRLRVVRKAATLRAQGPLAVHLVRSLPNGRRHAHAHGADHSAFTAASKNSSLSKDLRAAAKKSAKQIAKQF